MTLVARSQCRFSAYRQRINGTQNYIQLALRKCGFYQLIGSSLEDLQVRREQNSCVKANDPVQRVIKIDMSKLYAGLGCQRVMLSMVWSL